MDRTTFQKCELATLLAFFLWVNMNRKRVLFLVNRYPGAQPPSRRSLSTDCQLPGRTCNYIREPTEQAKR